MFFVLLLWGMGSGGVVIITKERERRSYEVSSGWNGIVEDRGCDYDTLQLLLLSC